MGVEEQHFVLSLFTTTKKKQELLKKDTSVLPRSLLQGIGAVPKGAVFSVFKKQHTKEAAKVYNFLIECDDAVFQRATHELKEELNEGLFLYALSTALLHRKSDAVLPPSWQIVPRQFFTHAHIASSRGKAPTPEADHFLTGTLRDPEFRVAWFREDIGLNDHHWTWHQVYPHEGQGTPPTTKDRQGELFYYMHQQMLARYDAERMAVGLRRVLPLQELDKPILEGYDPHLADHYGVKQYAPRPAGMVLASDYTDPDNPYTIQEHRQYINRLADAIKMGFFIKKDGSLEEVTIDNLGAAVESTMSSPNRDLYGNVHNMSHNLISMITDPDGRYQQNIGSMGDTLTATRDPVFFRLHKFFDNLFYEHKSRLRPYTREELEFADISVDDILVQTQNEAQPNVLKTFSEQRLVHINNARFNDDPAKEQHSNVEVIVNAASHREFEYKITVTNKSSKVVNGVFRIFLAPRYDELGRKYHADTQRRLFIEMDKFVEALPIGTPVEISRGSAISSVCRPRPRTLEDLTEYVKQGNDQGVSATSIYCKCGWPSNLLVPRGTSQGMTFDLFVMVTDWRADRVANNLGMGTSYCGTKSSQYPDRRSMGFPFDRRLSEDFLPTTPPHGILAFSKNFSNMRAASVEVVFEDKTSVRNNAPGKPEVLNY